MDKTLNRGASAPSHGRSAPSPTGLNTHSGPNGTDRVSVQQTPSTGGTGSAAAESAAARPGLFERLRSLANLLFHEVAKFGVIGALAFVVDFYVYNLMRTGVWPIHEAPMAGKPLLSKVVSVTVATVVSWAGNRYWTFRHRRRAAARTEILLFAVMNVGGLLIALGCTWFSHYALGLTSALADNIAANVVGLGLGTLFRFWAYRQFVFTETSGSNEAVGSNETVDIPTAI